MTTDHLTWSDNDGSIANCVAIADGKRFDSWYIFDAVAIAYGSAAEVMRGCLKPGAPRYEVAFPNSERRRYASLAAARRAIENHARRMYG